MHLPSLRPPSRHEPLPTSDELEKLRCNSRERVQESDVLRRSISSRPKPYAPDLLPVETWRQSFEEVEGDDECSPLLQIGTRRRMSRQPRASAPSLEVPRHASPPPRSRRHSSSVASRQPQTTQPGPPKNGLPPVAGAVRNLRRSQYAASIDTSGLINPKVLVKTKKQSIPLKDLRYLKQFFDQLDLNGDKTVDLEEVDEQIREQYTVGRSKVDHAQTIVATLHEHLRGGAGRALTFKGLLKLSYPHLDNEDVDKCVLAVVPPQRLKKTEEQRKAEQELQWVEDMWKYWDIDGSGELDEHEFKDVMSQLGSSIEDYQEFYREIDVDHSGTISKQEFKDWWVGRGQYKNVAKSFMVSS